jgi:hypothetical protein
MKLTFRHPVLAFTILTLTTATSFAGTLQSRDVARDPAWVVHVDCDALKKTELGKFILDEVSKPEAEKKIAAFQTIFGLDPRTQLHGLTVYSSTKSQDDGVLLVYADFDAARMKTLAEGAKEHESSGHGKHTIHSWIDDNKARKQGGKPRTYAAIHTGKLIVFSGKEKSVSDALDVLDGAKGNLSQNKSFSRLGAASSSFLVGAARKVDVPDKDPTAAVFKQSKAIWLSAGEANGKIEITLSLETDNEEVARQVESIGKGLVGLLALQKEKTNSVKLAEGLSIEQSKSEVIAKLSLRSADVVGMIKSAPKKKSED